jgi:hypothetical protein
MKSPSHEKAANTRVVIVVVVTADADTADADGAGAKKEEDNTTKQQQQQQQQPLYNVGQNLPTNTCYTLFQYQVKTE